MKTPRSVSSDLTADAARRERVVASGRLFLATTGLLAIYLDPTEPSRFAATTYGVMASYVLYAVAVLLFLRGRRVGPIAWVVHGADVAWATTLTFLPAGPNSVFYLYFMFTMLAAAFRWGFRETIGTALVTMTIIIAEALVLSGPEYPELDLNKTIVRFSYLFIMTMLLGYLAQQEKQWRKELLSVATVMKRPTVAAGMSGTLRAVGQELLHAFDARTILFVTQEYDATQVFVWSVSRSSAGAIEARLQQVDAHAADRYLYKAPRLWCAASDRHGVVTEAMTEDGGALRPIPVLVPPAFYEAHPCTAVMTASFELAEMGGGRVFVLDSARPASARALQFLGTLVDHVSPAIHNVYLLRRLRARAGAAERARVARELHDGAVQALIGLEMEIQALRLGKGQQAGLDAELEYMQALVRRQGLELRELMLQLRPLDLESTDRLPDLLASMVEKFRRDTGISARFVSTTDRMTIPPRAAVELARIVQESLVNVRRHSRANNVLVRLDSERDGWTLSIDDDGRGFGFSGRLSDRELDARRLGPAVIRERARAIGATLVIDSRPGAGARLEITLAGAVHV